MRIRNSFLLILLMAGGFSFSAMASADNSKEPLTLNKQFTKLLKDLEVDQFTDGKTLYVDFMINEKAEILVLATSSKKLDKTIKHKLNYKKLKTTELEYFKRYTLPVTVKK